MNFVGPGSKGHLRILLTTRPPLSCGYRRHSHKERKPSTEREQLVLLCLSIFPWCHRQPHARSRNLPLVYILSSRSARTDLLDLGYMLESSREILKQKILSQRASYVLKGQLLIKLERYHLRTQGKSNQTNIVLQRIQSLRGVKDSILAEAKLLWQY